MSTLRGDNGYGYCPVCGNPGVDRERRLNGNDRCSLGHCYPSADALRQGPAQVRQILDEAKAGQLAKLMYDVLPEVLQAMRERPGRTHTMQEDAQAAMNGMLQAITMRGYTIVHRFDVDNILTQVNALQETVDQLVKAKGKPS